MNNLTLYGWNETLFQQKQSSINNHLSHGRVSTVNRTCYEVVGEEGCYTCELSGNMLYGRAADEFPCTGDWVLFQAFDGEKGIIIDMLPREKTLYRRKSGTIAEKQAIATHVDKAFIVQSLDNNFNPRRVERLMLQVYNEKISPILVLTKSDLGFDEEKVKASLSHFGDKLPVFFTSIYSDEQIEELKKTIAPGETIVFVGSSGVGKSSLINAFLGKEILATSHISDSTGKGRHTTTRGELMLLPDSGILIDTPGTREFGVTADDNNSLLEIMDIASLTEKCHFSDCTHSNEPGCAVIEAVESGLLDESVYNSYLKLQREARYFSTSGEEKRKREKSLSKVIKKYFKNP